MDFNFDIFTDFLDVAGTFIKSFDKNVNLSNVVTK